jgi:hypothetical protein
MLVASAVECTSWRGETVTGAGAVSDGEPMPTELPVLRRASEDGGGPGPAAVKPVDVLVPRRAVRAVAWTCLVGSPKCCRERWKLSESLLSCVNRGTEGGSVTENEPLKCSDPCDTSFRDLWWLWLWLWLPPDAIAPVVKAEAEVMECCEAEVDGYSWPAATTGAPCSATADANNPEELGLPMALLLPPLRMVVDAEWWSSTISFWLSGPS